MFKKPERILKGLMLFICLTAYTSIFSNNAIGLVSPVNGFQQPDFTVSFKWNKLLSIDSYRLIIARDNSFSDKIYDISVTGTEKTITFDTSVTNLYWKVISNDTYIKGNSPAYQLTIFTPELYQDVLLWLSADKNTTLNPADSSISAWADRTSNNLNAVQPLVASQPKLKIGSNLIGSKPVVRLDGLDDVMLINSGGEVGSAYALFNFNSTGTFPAFNGLLTHQAGGENGIVFIGAGGSFGFYLSGSTCFNTMYVNQNNNNNFSPLQRFKVAASYKTSAPSSIANFVIGRERADNGRLWNGDVAEIILSKNNSANQFDIIHKYLYNKYAPPVTIRDTVLGNSFCTPVTISAPNNYLTYLWSTGATTTSVSVTPDKEYSVKVKDVFGFESTASFKVYPYRRLNNASVYICPGDTLKLDLKTPVGFTALWNTGANTTKINLTQSGQYTVKITDAGGCFVYDTINLVVDNPRLSITPVANTISACSGEKLFVQTETSFDSIRWSTGSTANFIQLNTSGTYSINATTSAGCTLNRSFNVNIVGSAPTARFNYGITCEGLAVNFSDSTLEPVGNNIQSWKWTFSNGDTSSLKNPSKIFQTLGLASAALKVTTTAGCSDSIFRSFVINKKPIPSFYNLLSCSGIPTTFVDQSIPNSAAVTDWSWDFGGLGISNSIQNPSFRFPSAGIYNVRLKATNSNGCFDTITIQTSVNVSPVSNFSYDSVCGKTPVNLKFLATVEPPSTIPDLNWGNWDFGDGTIETAIRNPQHVYAGPGTYEVRLIVKSSGQCIDTAIKQVKVFDFPTVDFSVSQTQCTGKEIQFTDISFTPDGTPLTKWNWFFSGLGSDTIKNPRYTFNTQGNYTIQLTARNSVGCVGTKLRSIAVSAPPVPKFTFSPNGLPAPLNVNYTNQSPLSGNYIWDYGDGSPLIQAYNPPQHQYTVNGSYPIKLIATDFRGCTDTLTKYILVDKAYLDGVMASITITPNGDYYKIQANVFNNSNIEITALGLSLQLGGGAVIRENWTGSLLPGQSVVYAFVGEIKIGESGQLPIVCATIDNINNNTREDRTDNNTTCKEVKVGSFDILNIYPNPAYDNINFGVMLPKDGRVNIRFIDIIGQQMYNKDFDGIKGYNAFAMPTAMLNAAVYVAEVSYDGEVIRKKFMRKDRK